MPTESDPVGALARELREARLDLWIVEHRVEEFLASLFPGWRTQFPSSTGWRFAPPDTIDVYDVVPSPAAVSALRRAGFLVVTLHGHDAGKFLSCSCQPEP